MTDIESAYAQLDHAHSEIRQLLQQRKDLRAERDAAFGEGARSMRERVLAGVVDLLETHGTTDDLLNDVDRLHALPLLPDDEPTRPGLCGDLNPEDPGLPECELRAGHEMPHVGDGDQWDDAPVYETPQELASEIERLRTEKAAGDEDFDSGWAAGYNYARADETRLAALEEQYTELAALVHGHGEDIGKAQAAIRGVGQALREHVQIKIDAIQDDGIGDALNTIRKVRRHTPGEDK